MTIPSLNLFQPPLPFFGIEQLRYDVSADAQTIEVRIKTNIKIKDLVDEDCKGWISAVKIGETDDAQTFDVAIKENKSGEKRIGYVAFDALEPGVSLPARRLDNTEYQLLTELV